MRTHLIYLGLLILQLSIGCQSPKSRELNASFENSKISIPPNQEVPTDTLFINPDFYQIDNSLFLDNPVQSAHLISYDAIWLTDSKRSELLIIGVATDFFQMSSHHFYADKVSTEILESLELHTSSRMLATLEDKKSYLNELHTQCIMVPDQIFVTNKGLKLGDSKRKAIELNGTPHESLTTNGVEKLTWNFKGDMDLDLSQLNPNEQVAKNSFGHHIELYFKNESLIGIVYLNGIP